MVLLCSAMVSLGLPMILPSFYFLFSYDFLLAFPIVFLWFSLLFLWLPLLFLWFSLIFLWLSLLSFGVPTVFL